MTKDELPVQFTRDDITPMALGAAVFGAGGGGDSHLTEGILAESIKRHGPIEVLNIDDIAADAPVALLALVGAPYVVSEMLVGRLLLEAALERSTAGQGQPAAIVTFEMAGMNALVPLIAAAKFGLPIIDADFTGRGVPALDMTSFSLDGKLPEVQVLSDPLGRSLQLHASSAFSTEKLLRPLIEVMGSLAAYTTYPLRGSDLGTRALDGTLTRCLEVGRIFQRFQSSTLEEVDALLQSIGGLRISSGPVIERLSQPDANGPRVSITLEDTELPGKLTRIDLKNEFHMVTRDGEVLATVPDCIVLVDHDSWIPLTVEQVGLGQQVTVIALQTHPRWRTARGIEVIGPRAFGYATEFVPFEQKGGGQ